MEFFLSRTESLANRTLAAEFFWKSLYEQNLYKGKTREFLHCSSHGQKGARTRGVDFTLIVRPMVIVRIIIITYTYYADIICMNVCVSIYINSPMITILYLLLFSIMDARLFKWQKSIVSVRNSMCSTFRATTTLGAPNTRERIVLRYNKRGQELYIGMKVYIRAIWSDLPRQLVVSLNE